MAVSSFVVPKIATMAWKVATGSEPPSEDTGSKLAPILVFSALSAVLVASSQYLMYGMTAKYRTDAKLGADAPTLQDEATKS